MNLKPNHLYEIFWQDCEHTTDWIPYKEIDQKIIEAEKPIQSVGYFIKATKDSYVFTSGINLSGEAYFDLVVIPLKVVIKIKKLN